MRAHRHLHPGNTPAMFHGRNSRIYDFVARRLLRRLYRRIAEDVTDAVPDGGAVLDVGTGPGVLLVEIAKRRADVELTGIDLSADMVTAANRNLQDYGDRAVARVGDVTGLEFPDDSFDLIVSSFSLHHWDDPENAVPELARVLRPGGRLYLYDFTHAPFDLVASSARERALFHDGSSTQTAMRTGIPFFRRCTRHVMVAGDVMKGSSPVTP
ncbi:class I SAM-dependent methyltransferase [Actinopolymorpha sp. B11F2]|uniref:class I SAM-dependent methyltransferase n=1 Tax=Actinopolymorpha sp. B11F2 TaxID=3160862 RepID=UPI0032E421A9